MRHHSNNVRSRLIPALVCFFFCLIGCLRAAGSPVFQLAPSAVVTGNGVFLQQLVKSDKPLPALRLCDAPQFGSALDLSRSQINDLLAGRAPGLVTMNWIGADAVHISRRTRTLNQAGLLALLTTTLQQEYVKDRGELELDMTQPWSPSAVPDEALTVKMLELPASGVAPSFIARFQLCTPAETVGTWEVSLQAHVWREVWVAHSDLLRGQSLADADVIQDRRDVLATHESLAAFSPGETTMELADSVAADNILLARDLKLRSVIHRGQVADAILQDGALNITMKVQALEDGAPGQIIHARNTVSKHDLAGKVLDDHTIQISL